MQIDLTDPAERAKAVQDGYIWHAPTGAIIAALEDIKAGRIPPPATIPDEFAGLAERYGVQATSTGGFAEGQGPV